MENLSVTDEEIEITLVNFCGQINTVHMMSSDRIRDLEQIAIHVYNIDDEVATVCLTCETAGMDLDELVPELTRNPSALLRDTLIFHLFSADTPIIIHVTVKLLTLVDDKNKKRLLQQVQFPSHIMPQTIALHKVHNCIICVEKTPPTTKFVVYCPQSDFTLHMVRELHIENMLGYAYINTSTDRLIITSFQHTSTSTYDLPSLSYAIHVYATASPDVLLWKKERMFMCPHKLGSINCAPPRLSKNGKWLAILMILNHLSSEGKDQAVIFDVDTGDRHMEFINIDGNANPIVTNFLFILTSIREGTSNIYDIKNRSKLFTIDISSIGTTYSQEYIDVSMYKNNLTCVMSNGMTFTWDLQTGLLIESQHPECLHQTIGEIVVQYSHPFRMSGAVRSKFVVLDGDRKGIFSFYSSNNDQLLVSYSNIEPCVHPSVSEDLSCAAYITRKTSTSHVFFLTLESFVDV